MMAEGRSEPRGPIAGAVARTQPERTGPFQLQIPLRAGETAYGTLRLTGSKRRPWSSRLVHRLKILCAIASTTERGFGSTARGPASLNYDPVRGPHEASILAAFLTFAQAQARRRHESLSLMEVAVDRLDSIRELLGDELAESAIERIMRAIKSTIRASDVVARLEAGRIAVLLPNANVENAMKVAEAIRAAIARAGAASTTMPTLSASIGLATYPDHAHDVAMLRAAASTSLTRARDQGNDQIAIAPPVPAIPLPTLTNRVG
jgi:diguanylate cyclase (GGDEF)-like protein